MKKKKEKKSLVVERISILGGFILKEIKYEFFKLIIKKIWIFLCLHPILLAISPIVMLIIFIIIWYFIMNS